uniref:Uncharacterized protein n=1 Tax=Anguilla anguilla TaxID=7936 RepID=A0A0E9XPR2_ANGAN
MSGVFPESALESQMSAHSCLAVELRPGGQSVERTPIPEPITT